MVNTIVSATASYRYQSGDSLGNLQSQLARYQKQLSDCVNCDSYNTLAGKRNAQQLNDKIAQVQTRIEQIQQRQAEKPSQETNIATGPSDEKPRNLGSTIDVYA